MAVDNKIIFQRIAWSSFYFTLITMALLMITSLWDQLLLYPTVTTMVSSTYPVNQVPFPGVSICSINKISRKRAFDLASEIANVTKRDINKIFRFVRFFGFLYDWDLGGIPITQLLEFQTILDFLGYSILNVTKRIAPPCEELLRSCYWQNLEVNCSKFFQLRLTEKGYCCVFNYLKVTTEFNGLIDQIPMSTEAGIENGLYASVNNIFEDFYYNSLAAVGIMVQIFVPTDFPDKSSGSVTQILCSPNTENFIELVPTSLVSVPDITSYSPYKRDCLFGEERATDSTLYSPGDCRLRCRIASIQALCQCVPFMFAFYNSTSICTLSDIECLERYKDKWYSFYPDGQFGEHLKKEKQNSLRCKKPCYSACSETAYGAYVTSFPTYNKTGNAENLTYIQVYYVNRFSTLFKQDVVYYWFEVLSNFGGIFGIFVGWSFISLIKISVYYLKKLAKRLFS